MIDTRSKKMVVVSHCILNVHSLEDGLAIYPGLEEEVCQLLITEGVGIFQLSCPEIELSGIFRNALPKDSYEHPKVRQTYQRLAQKTCQTLEWYLKKEYTIKAVIGAEGSPACGIDLVGQWKKNVKGKKQFPRDAIFVSGMGIFMEEFRVALAAIGASPEWIGIPGKSLRSLNPDTHQKTLKKLKNLLSSTPSA